MRMPAISIVVGGVGRGGEQGTVRARERGVGKAHTGRKCKANGREGMNAGENPDLEIQQGRVEIVERLEVQAIRKEVSRTAGARGRDCMGIKGGLSRSER